VSNGTGEPDPLPRAWRFDARSMEAFELVTPRPWNWLELDDVDAAQLWRILEEFVTYFNARYVERAEQLVPPCWAFHGALVEELTTLCWARYHAFESGAGSVGGAQFWHTYSTPGFIDRMTRWVGPDRLRKCQAGKHEEVDVPEPTNALEWEAERRRIARDDGDLRKPPPAAASGPKTAKTASPPRGGPTLFVVADSDRAEADSPEGSS
jgi:hypothetical protein